MNNRINNEIRELFWDSIHCNNCFRNNYANKIPNNIPQVRWIGHEYYESSCRIILILINLGSGKGYNKYKEIKNDPIENYKAGRISLEKYLEYQRNDMKDWGFGKFLKFYKDGLELDFNKIALANIAWCATENNKSPHRMLNHCFNKYTKKLIQLLYPKVFILSGVKTWNFELVIREIDNNIQFVKMWHYANRKSLSDNCLHIQEVKNSLK